MEIKVEMLVNGAVDFLLNLEEYQMDKMMNDKNPHIKVDIEHYAKE